MTFNDSEGRRMMLKALKKTFLQQSCIQQCWMVLNPFHRGLTADLGVLFLLATVRCIRLADVMSATRIVSLN